MQPFELMCDASGFTVRMNLAQKKGRVVHSIYYASKTMNICHIGHITCRMGEVVDPVHNEDQTHGPGP